MAGIAVLLSFDYLRDGMLLEVLIPSQALPFPSKGDSLTLASEKDNAVNNSKDFEALAALIWVSIQLSNSYLHGVHSTALSNIDYFLLSRNNSAARNLKIWMLEENSDAVAVNKND